MGKRKYTPFAVWPSEDNELWIDVRDCGIDLLVLMVDGFAFKIESGKHGRTYVSAKDVLAWHQREWAEWKRPHSDVAIKAIERALREHTAGTVQYQD